MSRSHAEDPSETDSVAEIIRLGDIARGFIDTDRLLTEDELNRAARQLRLGARARAYRQALDHEQKLDELELRELSHKLKARQDEHGIRMVHAQIRIARRLTYVVALIAGLSLWWASGWGLSDLAQQLGG